MIPQFRSNLRKLAPNKLFPAKLEILFALLFPRNILSAQSHFALPDTNAQIISSGISRTLEAD